MVWGWCWAALWVWDCGGFGFSLEVLVLCLSQAWAVMMHGARNSSLGCLLERKSSHSRDDDGDDVVGDDGEWG